MAEPTLAKIPTDPEAAPLIIQPSFARDLKWCRIASSTKHLVGKGMDLNTGVKVLQEHLEISNLPFVRGGQRHTANIRFVTQKDLIAVGKTGAATFDFTDGFITNLCDVSLIVFTADCVPIVLVEPNARIVGVVHAGWRGTFAEIARCALSSIQRAGGVPEKVLAWIGPAIQMCCYEVGKDLAGAFEEKFKDLPSDGKTFVNGSFLDLIHLNKLQLMAEGVSEAHIEIAGYCTRHTPDLFFSYRREGPDTGRNITSITRLV